MSVEEPARRNVLLITVDTVRADALGWNGQAGNPTPHIDALAKRSLSFDAAFATSPFTGPSHASMFTGQHPSRHGVIYNGHRVRGAIGRDSPVLAELLSARGYATKGVVSSGVVSERFGFGRGFDGLERACESKHGDMGSDGGCASEAALDWLEQREARRPFFLWVHYMDPHFPYVVAPEMRQRVGLAEADMVPLPVENMKAVSQAQLRRAYQADVSEADAHVGALLAGLDRLGLTESTVVALIADHGEFLGEHGLYEHLDTYDEVLHVPMLLSVPGMKPERRGSMVSMIDLLPSLLEAVAVEIPRAVQGTNLLDPASKAYGRPAFAEWRHYRIVRGGDAQPGDFQLAVRTPEHKLVLDLLFPKDGNRFFDLKQDPSESRNLFSERPDGIDSLEALLRFHRENDVDPALLRPAQVDMSADDLKMLKALGYAQ